MLVIIPYAAINYCKGAVLRYLSSNWCQLFLACAFVRK